MLTKFVKKAHCHWPSAKSVLLPHEKGFSQFFFTFLSKVEMYSNNFFFFFQSSAPRCDTPALGAATGITLSAPYNSEVKQQYCYNYVEQKKKSSRSQTHP